MAYLARISSLNRGKDSMGTIQANVLEANTILDAVGNARTIRNDNSSRFGKYIKLHFDKTGELVGASLDTFLLETTRVVRRNEDEERNFHIFYLICSESDKSEREALKINSASSYAYLNSSGIYDRRDGVKDSDMLQQFKKSMNMLGIDPECMQSLLKCFVVILTVGNIKFSSHTTNAGTVEIKIQESTKKYLADAAVLLGIPALDLLRSFTTRNMVVAGERVDVTLTSSQAEDMRDVFAKSLYNVIFAWIIEFLNVQLSFDDHSFESFSLSSQGLPKLSKRASSKYILAGIDQFGARIRTDSDSSTFSSVIQSSAPGMIGILDIFGFEKQPHNGLEQLLINYANECLQKQYDEVMIDAEQAYYATEGISWDLIEFPSNKDCIELISSKMTSVLTLLDEACLAPSGSDTSFIRQVYKNLSKQSRMHLTARIQGRNEFGIKHYAGNVVYSVEGFVKKNKNEIFPLALLKVSKNDFVARIGRSADAEENNTNGKTEGNLSPKKSKRFLVSSISNSFKNNVSQLIATLNETQTAYVKCIKPNSLNVKSNFMNQFVCEQLRCNGIMQTIVVTRCGFPIRYTYNDFDDRYYSLLRALVVGKEYSITVGIDAVIARLRKALSSGEIRISENTTTLNSLSSLQQSSKSDDSTCYNSAEMSGWGIQRGHTRVFLRYNEYHALNCLHNNMVGIMATQIQKVYRGYVCFSLFQKKKLASTKIKRSYIRFHRELMLMTSVLIIQDFFRMVVASVVNEKKEAGRIVAAFAYKYLHVRTKAEALRKRHLIVKIQRWWRRFPWYISPDQRVLLNALFSPIISPLQIAAREKIAAVKRKSNVKGRRLSNGKETPSKRSSFSCKKNREENPVWHSGSPNVSGSFDSSNNGHQVQQPITCRDLLKANSQILWTIFSFYSKEKANVPGNSVSSSKRNSMGLVTAAGMINLLRDWSLIPSLCSQYKANKLLKEQFFKDKPSRNLISFSQFLSFVNKLASSFYKDNDTRELTDKIRFLDSKFHWSDEVIALKHLLSVMNASDGRNRFSQARNAGLIPSFLGVYGSEEALLVYLESQTGTLNHIEANNIHVGPTSRKDLTPSFREVEMCDAVHQLMRKNESTLISLALRYTLSKSSVTASPGNKKESRKSSVILPFEAVFNCLHDFDVCPTLCRFVFLWKAVVLNTFVILILILFIHIYLAKAFCGHYIA